MGCGGSSTNNHDEIEYLNGEPTFEGDMVVKGFEKDNGLLFRIVNRKTREWAFYNDTKDYVMDVRVTFKNGGKLKALGKTQLRQLENGDVEATVQIAPLATEMFIKGKVNGFTSKMKADPIDDDHDHDHE